MSIKIKRDTRQFINQAWIRNGRLDVTGEPLILACLLHTTGAGRNTDDMKTVQALMNDINLEDE